MRIRLLILIGVVLATALPTAGWGAGGGDAGFSATHVGRLRFPETGFLVDLPTGRRLTASDVVVRENGRIVANPSFVPVQEAKARFTALLLVDASNSMKGRPLTDAFAAGRQFVQQLGEKQRVGVLTFNEGWSLLQAPTADRAELAAALSHPPETAYGTRIYDALVHALDVLKNSDASASSIVVLSDGVDVGSTSDEKQVAAAARRLHVRIFTVGLRGPTFRPAVLQTLARDTSGTYVEASDSSQLAAVYRQIGRLLANEYLLRYRSESEPGANVVVTLQIQGLGLSTFTYTAPKDTAVAPYHRPLLDRFWSSGASLGFVALLTAALAAAGLVALVRGPRSTIRERIAEFATISSRPVEAARKPTPKLSRLLFGRTENTLARTRWWTRFREELEIAEIPYSAEQLLAVAIVGTLLVGLLLWLLLPVFSVFGLLVPFAVYSYCRRQLRRLRWRFEEQLPDNLQVLASAVRAGHSFVGALAVVAESAEQPARREFTRVVADEQLGVPLEDSLREVARRMANDDVEQVALVAELQRRTGGNMAEVLERVIETVRGRFDLRRLVHTLTAQGRMARWVLTALPLFLLAVISLINPHYLAPLFSSTGGQVALAVAAFMVVTGSLVIKRIVDIKV